MNRTLRKALMTTWLLKRTYNLDRISINIESYMNKQNICISFLRKSKTQYFNSIDVKNVIDNKKFWKNIIPKVSNICKTANTIILVKNEDSL